jgi:hypothetical protein
MAGRLLGRLEHRNVVSVRLAEAVGDHEVDAELAEPGLDRVAHAGDVVPQPRVGEVQH